KSRNFTPRSLCSPCGMAIITSRSLPCSTAGKTFALSLKNDTGDATTPGVHVRHVAGSPKVSDRSHLNLGFKVVSPHRHGGEPFFRRRLPPGGVVFVRRAAAAGLGATGGDGHHAAPPRPDGHDPSPSHPAPRAARTPPRAAAGHPHRRRPGTGRSHPRPALPARTRLCRRLLGDGWRDRPARAAAEAASGTGVVPAGARWRAAALFAV